MIDEGEQIRCGWCSKTSILKDWDELTFSKCANREMKRAYMHLNQEKAFRKSDTFYMCPKCGKWSRGSQLAIIDSKNEKLAKLGREPVMGSIQD